MKISSSEFIYSNNEICNISLRQKPFLVRKFTNKKGFSTGHLYIGIRKDNNPYLKCADGSIYEMEKREWTLKMCLDAIKDRSFIEVTNLYEDE